MNRSLAALSFASLAALAVTSGCRGDDGGDDDGVTVDAPSDDTRIQDVQSDAMVVDTAVTLRGVVVVAKDEYGQRTGNFYVMEPEGGEYSGVLVFGATTDQLTSLQIGDLVDITGVRKDEFSCPSCDPPDDKTVTELAPVSTGSLQVTKVGTAPVPAPHVLDTLAFGRMSKEAREAEYEKWEGVLIRVENVRVLDNIDQIGSTDATFRGFPVTGLVEVDSTLAAIPAPPDAGVTEGYVTRGDCLASVTGMGDYFFEYKVLPRMTADIVKGGTGCAAEEADATACSDGMDNEADGFADCMDFSCSMVPACQTAASVVNIQNGTIMPSTRVNLTNVVVTAVSSNRKNLWVADAAQAAQYNGVMVFRGNSAAVSVLPAEIVVGARVNVSGRVDEFNNDMMGGTLTQIGGAPVVTFVAGNAVTPVPVTGVSMATLTTDATGEPYEGVLLEIANVRVTGTADMFGVRSMGIAGNTMLFVADDDLSTLTSPNDTCFTMLRGIWSYQVNQNKWAILPLGGAGNATVDMTGAACN